MTTDDLKQLHALLDKQQASSQETLTIAQYADTQMKWEMDACARASKILAAIAMLRKALDAP